MADIGPTVPLDTIPAFDFGDEGEEETTSWARLVPLATNRGKFDDIELNKDEHVFGRLPTNDTVFKELGISGKHCKIFKEVITSSKSSTTIVKIEDMRYVASLSPSRSTRGSFTCVECVCIDIRRKGSITRQWRVVKSAANFFRNFLNLPNRLLLLPLWPSPMRHPAL